MNTLERQKNNNWNKNGLRKLLYFPKHETGLISNGNGFSPVEKLSGHRSTVWKRKLFCYSLHCIRPECGTSPIFSTPVSLPNSIQLYIMLWGKNGFLSVFWGKLFFEIKHWKSRKIVTNIIFHPLLFSISDLQCSGILHELCLNSENRTLPVSCAPQQSAGISSNHPEHKHTLFNFILIIKREKI